MKRRKPPEVARQEAYEEAGLIGQIVDKRPFVYEKRLATPFSLCPVRVFSFRVDRQLADWPEKDQRQIACSKGLSECRGEKRPSPSPAYNPDDRFERIMLMLNNVFVFG
jgi:8-oxo-dGTP pyrophosphatase MutT (NUDIX family)